MKFVYFFLTINIKFLNKLIFNKLDMNKKNQLHGRSCMKSKGAGII